MVVTQLPGTNSCSEGFGSARVSLLEASGCVVATPPVSLDSPDCRNRYAHVAQLDSLEAHAPEEVEPTEQDRRSATYVGPEKKAGRCKKLSARKDVQDLIKEMDPASCGPLVQTAEVPEVILRLNDEYKDLLPCALPP